MKYNEIYILYIFNIDTLYLKWYVTTPCCDVLYIEIQKKNDDKFYLKIVT